MATILVTGASGFVGSHTIPTLIAAGHRVRGLTRTADAELRTRSRLSSDQLGSIEFARGDVSDPRGLQAAVTGVDAIVHLVAIPRDLSGGREMARVNTGGTQHVIRAALDAGVRRFVHLGALGVLDDPRLHYARSKARAEREVQASGLDWTILKPSLMFGERDGFFNQIALLARLSPGVMPIPGGSRTHFQPLWVGDLARAIRTVLELPESVGRIYELGGPEQLTYREMTALTLREMGKRRMLLPMPQSLIRMVARGSEVLHLPFPVASDQLRQLAFDNITDPDSVVRAFGFEPRRLAGSLGYLRRGVRDQEPTHGTEATG